MVQVTLTWVEAGRLWEGLLERCIPLSTGVRRDLAPK